MKLPVGPNAVSYDKEMEELDTGYLGFVAGKSGFDPVYKDEAKRILKARDEKRKEPEHQDRARLAAYEEHRCMVFCHGWLVGEGKHREEAGDESARTTARALLRDYGRDLEWLKRFSPASSLLALPEPKEPKKKKRGGYA